MVLSNVFNSACGFLFWMIAARLYTVEQVGHATALISSLSLVLLFSRLGFDTSIIRFFSSEDSGRIISTSLIITTAACILAGAILILLPDSIAPSMSFLREPKYAISFLLIGAFNSIAAVTGIAFIAGRKADHFFMQNLFMAFRIPALIPLAFLGILGIFGSVGLAYLVASLFGLAALKRNIAAIGPNVDVEFVQKSFRFSSWNYISSLLFVAPTPIISLMVLNMLGEAEAAKYYIAFAIGNLVQIIPISLSTSLFVEGSQGEGLKRSVMRAGWTILLFLVPAVLMLLIFGDVLLGMLKREYMEALDLLRIIALSSFLVAIHLLFVPIQNVRIRVESIVKLNALRFLLMLGLSYLLLQMYGILGAGYAWIATYAVIDVWIALIAWKEGWI
jgi:O-antigen/teichoic acid export membrane protein